MIETLLFPSLADLLSFAVEQAPLVGKHSPIAKVSCHMTLASVPTKEILSCRRGIDLRQHIYFSTVIPPHFSRSFNHRRNTVVFITNLFPFTMPDSLVTYGSRLSLSEVKSHVANLDRYEKKYQVQYRDRLPI